MDTLQRVWGNINKALSSKKLIELLPFSIILLSLLFLYSSLQILVFILLVPYLYYIRTKLKLKSTNGIILKTWAAGFIFSLLITGWLLRADTRAWTQLGGASLQLMVFVVWLLMGLFLSMGFLLLGIWIEHCVKKQVLFNWVLYSLPFIWVSCEYLRSFLFSVFTYGKGGSIGPYWNFGVLGYAVAGTPIITLSKLIGLFGLTFIAVCTNIVIFQLFRGKFVPIFIFVCLLLLGTVFTSKLYNKNNGQEVYVATTQMSSVSPDYYKSLEKAIPDQNAQKARVLVLPEYSSFFEGGAGKERQNITDKVFNNNQGTVIYTRHGLQKSGSKSNDIVTARPNGTIVGVQGKSFLVPTGEYMPKLVEWILKIGGQPQVVQFFNNEVGVAKSSQPEKVTPNDGINFGSLACSGVINANTYRNLTSQGAQLLTNSASLYEFRNSANYHQQARQFARFVAVSNNRTFIQSARGGGNAYIIDQNGRFIYQSGNKEVSYGVEKMGLNEPVSLYTLCGEYVAYLSLILSTVIIFTGARYLTKA